MGPFLLAFLLIFVLWNDTVLSKRYGTIQRSRQFAHEKKIDVSDVVITISFSGPYFKNIKTLQWMYQHFGRIYFCADLTNATDVPVEVHNVPVDSGWMQHKCLLEAMHKYPDFKGYIGSNDDLVLHPWVINTWNFSKVWFEECKRITPIFKEGLLVNNYAPGNTGHDFLGDDFPCGKEALKKAHKLLPNNFSSKLSRYLGHVDAYCEGDNDFIYVPAAHKRAFINIATIFDETGTGFPWLYSATVYGLFDGHDIFHPNGTWLWGTAQRNADLALVYDINTPLIHPIKLSNRDHADAVIAMFEKGLRTRHPLLSKRNIPSKPYIPPPPFPPCTYHESNTSCPMAKSS